MTAALTLSCHGVATGPGAKIAATRGGSVGARCAATAAMNASWSRRKEVGMIRSGVNHHRWVGVAMIHTWSRRREERSVPSRLAAPPQMMPTSAARMAARAAPTSADSEAVTWTVWRFSSDWRKERARLEMTRPEPPMTSATRNRPEGGE